MAIDFGLHSVPILVCLPKSNLSIKQSATNPQFAQDERIRQQWNEMTGWLVCNNADCLQYWLFAQICANITWQRGSERGDRGLSQEWVTLGTLLKHKQTLTGGILHSEWPKLCFMALPRYSCNTDWLVDEGDANVNNVFYLLVNNVLAGLSWPSLIPSAGSTDTTQYDVICF